MSFEAPDAAVEPNVENATRWPLLGTIVDVDVTARDRAETASALQTVCDEVTRLERLFSPTDESSMLNRWSVDPSTITCDEFDELLSTALRWQRSSRGAFNVSAARLASLWTHAASDGCRPSPGELQYLAAEIAHAPFTIDRGRLRRTGDCSHVDLHAVARGFIVDRAARAAWSRHDLESLTLRSGLDVVHLGTAPITVGIDDPSAAADGAPLVTVEVLNAATSTRGSARRTHAPERDRSGPVIDPRSGLPGHGSPSVTVVAPNAITADIVAAIVAVMEPAEGISFVGAVSSSRVTGHPSESFGEVQAGPISCWIVDRCGALHHGGS